MRGALAAVVWISLAVSAAAQSVTSELSGTAGVSSQDVGVAASQARIFGEVYRFTFFTEAAWSSTRTWRSGASDEALATAYPYDGPHVMDAYVESHVGNDRVFSVIRGGRFRTPFGIHDASDYAYNGFLRAPLIRYEGYWGLTNRLFEHGVNVMAGTSRLQGEATLGRPFDASDDYHRRAGADVVLRAQTYAGPFVLGVSHVESHAYDLAFASGRMVFTGLDVRWMQAGVQVRSEWLIGRPWDQAQTSGGYVDVMVHRAFMGPATLVGRVETLDYRAANPAFSSTANGLSAGTRVKVAEGLFVEAGVTRRPSAPYGPVATATDVALTYTARYHR
jgi:hypothetical protein